ncbi:amino acid ABC transporter substrate-binding protein [Desulfonema magnum]|uniref:Amino acid ABC transporter, substrate-binding protein n=1 Tax=Desulfonema magnum TaxID=45655 RepID=A0A975GT03_9BACT|nr:amino acid ABC transporter substrate-binding protein [Desulfonema magnum]QTA92487.1 Amino acid ABC transporter, substrate-binding protein [Desulfonema magnum]
MNHFRWYIVIAAAVFFVTTGIVGAGETLNTVKTRGVVQIGVNDSVLGLGIQDEKGRWHGLNVDTGRAVAAAVFGDTTKAKFIPLTAVERFTALQSGEIDVLCHSATQTLHRDTALGADFVHVNYYDGQGFMVAKKSGIKSAKELDGATVCILPGTTTELNAADFFRSNDMKWKPVIIEQTAELSNVFFSGQCDCMISDVSQLAGLRAVSQPPGDYIILPEIISKEPLAPAVRHGDDQWRDIVNYSVLAMINAEELGITSKNVDKMLKSKKPSVRRFLGVTPGNGKDLGLDEKFAYNIVKQVGNYGEVFERNLGPGTRVGLERGLNALWKDGGLMYSPPFR